MGEIILIVDIIAAAAVCAVAYILYRKFIVPTPKRDELRQLAYEEGFADAVRYFGLRKLYEEDDYLRKRLDQVFSEAGVSHRFAAVLEGIDQPASKDKGRKVPERQRT